MAKKSEAHQYEVEVLKGKNERWLITHWLDTKDKVPRVSVGLQYLDNKVMPPTYKFKPGGFALTKAETLELAKQLIVMAGLLPEAQEDEDD